MKIRRLVLLVASLLALLGGSATAALASPTAGHAPVAAASVSNDHITNYMTGHDEGGNGSGKIVDNGTYNSFTAINVGTVSNVSCWPFTCGNGANNTYNGDNVWEWTETGSPNTCIQVSGSFLVTSSACGSGHDGSYFVSTKAPNGASGYHGLVSVYLTDSVGGTGQYEYDAGSGSQIASENWDGTQEEAFKF